MESGGRRDCKDAEVEQVIIVQNKTRNMNLNVSIFSTMWFLKCFMNKFYLATSHLFLSQDYIYVGKNKNK